MKPVNHRSITAAVMAYTAIASSTPLVAQSPEVPEGTEVIPRITLSADYFRYVTELNANTPTPGGLVSNAEGEQKGDIYGATLGIRVDKDSAESGRDEDERSWLTFGYRQGTLRDRLDYDPLDGTFDASSAVNTKLDEFQIRYRTEFRKIYVGLDFTYQNWKTTESFTIGGTPGSRVESNSVKTYIPGFFLGYAPSVRLFGSQFDFGWRTEVGAGFGYRTATRYLSNDGYIGNLTGQSGLFLRYTPKWKILASFFVEAGVKGLYYYTSEDEIYNTELLWGPMARAGVRIGF